MWKDFSTAMALVLVIEGILPFLSPAEWQKAMQTIAQKNPRFIRRMGLVSMLAGCLLLFWLKSH